MAVRLLVVGSVETAAKARGRELPVACRVIAILNQRASAMIAGVCEFDVV